MNESAAYLENDYFNLFACAKRKKKKERHLENLTVYYISSQRCLKESGE